MLPFLLLRCHELQNLLEYRIDILILLGAAVCKTPVASHYALGLLIGNLFCVQEIRLIAHQNHAGHALTVLLELFDPVFDTIETLAIADVEHYYHCIAVAVVEFKQGAVTLLTCGVPNLSGSRVYFQRVLLIFVDGVLLVEASTESGLHFR